jgi:hypothetical protein
MRSPAPLPQTSLDSSSLLSVGYSAAARIMEIAFHSRSIYRYLAVPPDVHQALLAASSKGRYFNAAIRSSFRFERLCRLVDPGTVSEANSSSSPPGAEVADVSRQTHPGRRQLDASGQLTGTSEHAESPGNRCLTP